MRAPKSTLAYAIVAAAVLSGSSYYYEAHQEATRASCQSHFNQAFADTLQQRSAIGQQSSEATQALLSGVGDLVLHPAADAKDQAASNAQFAKLFRDYIGAAAKVAQSRADHPYPTLPTDCR